MPGAKGWIEVNEKYCKGCELCLSVCPPEVMELDHAIPVSAGRLVAAKEWV